MALTQDQSEMLQTAVNNLNASVEVNKEVLEIVKSVGNTGAVDISLHDNNKSAHANGVNQILALNSVFVGSKTFFNGEASAIRLSTSASGGYGNGELNLYAKVNPTAQGSSSNLIRFYQQLDASDANETLNLGAISSYIRKGEDSNSNPIRLSFSRNTYGYVASIGVDADSDHSQAARTYFFTGNALMGTSGADLGSSTFQFKDCYLQNSPIVSSDERLKQDIADVPEAVFRAWERVGFKQYRFKEAVEKKGADARLHVGMIAQQILAAFEAEGLDATKYGIVCHDEWEDQYVTETITDAEAVLDEKGNIVTPEKTHQEKRFVKAAGDLWTVRYEEALALETAYQRWRLSKIEAALAAKGITL